MASFVQQIKIFNDNYKSFHDEMQEETNNDKKKFIECQFTALHEIRKSITVNENKISITQRDSVLDNFVILLINEFEHSNALIKVGILRTFNRLSQVYSQFLNQQNIDNFKEMIQESQLPDEDPLVNHYSLILIGKIIRQSKILAQDFFIKYYPLIISKTDFLSNDEYYSNLTQHYHNICSLSFNPDNYVSKCFRINSNHGNPYFYLLGGFTEMLSDSDLIRDNLEYTVRYVLKFMFDERRNSSVCIFSTIQNVKILNDLFNTNYPEITKILQTNEFMFLFILNSLISFCNVTFFYDLIAELLKLIGLIIKNGFELDEIEMKEAVEFVLKNIFHGVIEIQINAAGCIYNIISSKGKDGFDMLFGDNEMFSQLIELLLDDENLQYIVKVEFFKLAGLSFQFYTKSSLVFDADSFIKYAISLIDHEFFDISFNVIFALKNLFLLMKKLGLEQSFISSFIENNGKIAVENLIKENDDLLEISKEFLNLLND